MPLPPGLSQKDADQVLRAVMDDDTNRLRVDAVISPSGHDLEIHYQDDSIAIGDPASDNILAIQSDGSIKVDIQDTSLEVTQGTTPWVVSGTVTANAGTDLNTSLLAKDSTLTDKSQFTKITDGTDTALVTGAGELNVLATAQPGVDIGDVTINNASGAAAVNIQDGGNSITVDGTVTANQGTSPWVVTGSVTTSPDVNIHDSSGNSLTSTAGSLNVAGTGNFTVVQPTGSNLHVEVDSGTINANQAGTWTVQPGNTPNVFPWLTTINQGGNSATVTVANALKVDASWYTTQVAGAVKILDQVGIPFNSNGAGALTVEVENSSIPVTQSGTWNINNISGTISLPTGASTSALQTTGNSSLSSIDSKLNSLGQKTMANSVPVVIASDQSPVAVTGTITTSPNVNVHDGAGVSISSTGSSLNVDVTNTVPVSQSGAWTVTANAGTNLNTSALALDATLTNKTQFTKITDGTDTALVTAAGEINVLSTAQPGVDIGDVTVNNAGGASAVNIQDGGNSITVDGTVAATQSGTWTVQPGNTANTTPWLTTINQGGNSATVTAANALKVDGSAVTQPVSGTVTANQGGAPWSQNITQVGGSAVTLGQKTMANSFPVVISSDQTVIPVSDNAGSLTVDQATAANLNAQVVGNIANAATDSGNPIKTGAIYNSTIPTYTSGQRTDSQSDIRGSHYVNIEGRRRTYSSASLSLTLATSPTDVFTITGAASTVITIKSIRLSLKSTNTVVASVQLLKRSTANSAGTSTSVTKVAHNSGDAAASASVLAYTANPTTGTLVGAVRVGNIQTSGANSVIAQPFEWNFNDVATQPIKLLSTSEVLAVNFNGTTVAGGALTVDIEWTEE